MARDQIIRQIHHPTEKATGLCLATTDQGRIDTLKYRFLDHVVQQGDCYVWTGTTRKNGYGHFAIQGRIYLSHRISYLLFRDNIPPGLCVLHRCDNPQCITPKHLFLGTLKDNVYDCIAKGRARRGHKTIYGEKHANAKLSNAVVELIRKYRREGWTLKEISELCHVSMSLISMIINGKRWKHLNKN